MPDVLLTGGAGFIGCALSRRLLDAGHRVVAVDNLHPQVHPTRARPADLPEEVELVVGDVVEAPTWDAVLGTIRPEIVFHLAAETGTGQSFTESTRHGLVNVVGTTRMLDALRAADAIPTHLVVASSRAVYGEGAWRSAGGTTFYPRPRTVADLEAGRWDPAAPDGTPSQPVPSVAGTTELHPVSVYGATKLTQEMVGSAWTSGTGTQLSVLRFQNVYGPGQSLTNSYTGIVALFSRLAAAGQEIDVYEDGEIVRDFVYIDDVARALALLVDRPLGDGRPIDIGSGRATTVHEVAKTVAALRGAPAPRVSGNWRIGDIRAASCDPAPAAEALDFEAAWSVEDGLRALLDWIDTLG